MGCSVRVRCENGIISLSRDWGGYSIVFSKVYIELDWILMVPVVFLFAQYVFSLSHGLLMWQHTITSQLNLMVKMHPRCVCCCYKLSLGLMTWRRGRCSIFPYSCPSETRTKSAPNVGYGLVHRFHYENHTKSS
jgi:hypothetical protein